MEVPSFPNFMEYIYFADVFSVANKVIKAKRSIQEQHFLLRLLRNLRQSCLFLDIAAASHQIIQLLGERV